MALRDLAQKGFFSPGTPSLAMTPNPTSVHQGISLYPLKQGTLPYSQKTEARRREAAWGGELRNRSARTHSPGKQTRTQRLTCTHMHRHTGPPQCQRLGRTGLGSGSSSSMPWPFPNLAIEGVEMLRASLSADSKRALGQSDLILTLGALRPEPGPAPLPGQPALLRTCR